MAPPTSSWPQRTAIVGVGNFRWDVPSVKLDADAGIEAALRHLKLLGHQKVMYLGRRSKSGIIEESRLDSFRIHADYLGLKTYDQFVHLDVPAHSAPDWIIGSYLKILPEVFQLPPGVTGVLCFNDFLAASVCSVIAQRGLSVPKDVSIIGFDDIYAASAIPPLTTISHMLPELGARAVEMVLSLKRKTTDGPKTSHIERIAAKLVVRGSCGSAPAM